MSAPKPTIRDIASASGFSRSAVSLALRNDPSIPENTRNQIKQVAEELGYQQNPYVNSFMAQLRRNRPVKDHATIGLVNTHPYSYLSSNELSWVLRRLIKGAEKRAAELGYKTEECWLGQPHMTAARMYSILKARSIRGLFILPLHSSRGRFSMPLDRFASVTVGYALIHPPMYRVCNHHFTSFTEAFEELRRLGYRRIGIAMHKAQDTRTSHILISSYLGMQHVYQTRSPVAPHVVNKVTTENLIDWVEKEKPDAIISSLNTIPEMLQAAGYRLPEDIGFASLNWDPKYPQHSGIDLCYELIGSSAIDMISAQLMRNEYGLPENPRTNMTMGKWVAGQTTRPRSRK
ncbi:LacI family DNA-binding transcriptional regulator [Coraliomargarita parva]|uniref:LacI family DNA-binding transcriptional regulator n=1 Tax=Coraliomargarita parva TaxID=3014050 RepID=UPI0022B3E6DD|nr:LacI family DNA-binding transcriptional regulator [Coraliomargarita parva]